MSGVRDQWAAGSAYERFMGRWSRELAGQFVEWLDVPAARHWLDVGCGTGALTEAIVACADPSSIVACDPSASFIEYAQAHSHDDRVTFVVGSVDELPIREEGYDSVASLLALNFFPDAEAALARLSSVAAANAVISACVWDYAAGMQFLRYFWDSAVQVSSSAAQYDEGVRFPICNPGDLTALFRGAGLDDIRCEPVEIGTEFVSFEDYWEPLLGGTGPAPTFLASLDQHDIAVLRRKLETALPVNSNGRIALRARAWAIRGVTGWPDRPDRRSRP